MGVFMFKVYAEENDENISLNLYADDIVEDTYTIDYPQCGYGGGNILISPQENYALFESWSGQSDHAFVLFKICNKRLEKILEEGYCYGEAQYIFDENEKTLFQLNDMYEWIDATPGEISRVAKLRKYNLYDLSQTEKDIMYHFTKDFEDGFQMNFEVKDNRIRLILEGEEFEIK